MSSRLNSGKKKRTAAEQYWNTKENVKNGAVSSRKCLQDRFELEESKYKVVDGEKRCGRYRFSTTVLGSPFHPRRALKSGTDKLTKTINNVRTTFDSISQRLRSSTRRRTLFSNDGSPTTPLTPEARSRRLLGRTPTKLYGPFSIESPPYSSKGDLPKHAVTSCSRSGVNNSVKKQLPRCRHRMCPGEVREACGSTRCLTCTAHFIRMSLRV